MDKYLNQLNKKQLLCSLCALFFCLIVNFGSTQFIYRYFPNRFVNPDLLFIIDNPPVYLEYISETFFILCGLIFFIYLIKYGFNKLHVYLNTISITYVVRGLFTMLTPMMRPTGVELPSHGFLRDYFVQAGMFPSGHIALIALIYFFIDIKKDKFIKYLYLISFILSTITMVISKGHYSIDVVGGILIAYVVYNEISKRIEL